MKLDLHLPNQHSDTTIMDSGDDDDIMIISDQFDFAEAIDSDDETRSKPPDSRRRPGVGNGDIFSREAFGALRPGMLNVQRFRDECFPLMFCAALAGVLFIWWQYPVKQMVMSYFYAYHKPKKDYVNLLPPWCGVVPVVVGLLSDCLPLFRYRRKSYIALGYSIVCLGSLAMAVVAYVADPTKKSTAVLNVTLLCVINIGQQIAWTILLAASVEFAQRETLHQRGHLQTRMFIIYYGGMWVTQIGAASVLHPKPDGIYYTSSLSLGAVALVHAVLAVLPLVVLFFFWHENEALMIVPYVLRKRVRELWRLLSQKAVYQLIVALAVMVVFSAANNSNVNSVARFTSGFTGANVQWLYLSAYIPRCVAAMIWKRWLINVSWRITACAGFIFLGAFKSVTTLMLIHDILRGRMLYLVMSTLSQIPQGWLLMFQVIPVTEISYMGREGMMIGLVATCSALITIGTGALWAWVQKAVNLDVTMAEITADTAHMRVNATLAALLIFGFNMLCITMTLFLPRQKLDAQQMRAFGGYHPTTRNFLVVVLLALLAFDLHNNVTKLLKL